LKLALITDTHWGVRGDNVKFLEYFKRYYTEFFFPELEKRGIKQIVHLGDLMDRRKYVNIYTAHCVKKYFFDQIHGRGLYADFVLGNHDTYLKNTNVINSFNIVSPGGLNSFQKATEVTYDGCKILLVPWICDENREHTFETVKNTKALYCFGHFEFGGFQMYKGLPSHGGIGSDEFKKFDLVCSGHYHHRSRSGNIQYIGAAMEYTWSDSNDPRGFAVFDTESGELEFVDSQIHIFEKVLYDDMQHDVMNTEFGKFADKIVKVVIKNKTNPYVFDQFIEKIEEQGVIEMQVVEDHLNLDIQDDDSIIDEAESTIDIFTKFVDQTETGGINKSKIKNLMVDLYQEAITLE
jgi:predicted phosphodiesterase